MNARLAMALVLVLAVIGAYVLVRGLGGDPPPVETETFIYDIDERAITLVEITNLGSSQRFVRDDVRGQWVFDDEQRTTVQQDRWGGIPLLLAGPRVQRVLAVDDADLGRYGLDEPATTIHVGLNSGETVTILMGILTPDGVNHYAKREGATQIALIDRSWGDVLVRLVTDPPR